MNRTPFSPAPLVYAHRGDRSRAADNTIEAYELAVAAGTDGIELDVRRTQDGVLIVSHDDHIPSLKPFASLEFPELRELAPQVPTLREAMDAIPRRVFVNVEIKNFSFDAGFDEERLIVDEAIDELRTHDDPERIFLSSFDPQSNQRAREVGPEFLCGQLLLAVLPLDAGIAVALELGLDAIVPHLSHLKDDPTGAMDQIRNAGLRAVVWGVIERYEVEQMRGCGVDGIITDDPGQARAVLDQR